MSRISIITATYNAAQHLPRLIASLRAQTNKNFEWVVADGGSTDGTLGLLNEVKNIDVIIDSRPDFGIYDALNRAIKLCSGEYYLVLGADDELCTDSIDNFLIVLHNNNFPDIVAANVKREDGFILTPTKKWKFFFSQRRYVAAHAVGTLINKKLHSDYGFYSAKFPIAADQLFLKTVGDAGCKIHYEEFIAGKFCMNGISNTDRIGAISEFFRIQLMTGESKGIQFLLYFLRLLKNFHRA